MKAPRTPPAPVCAICGATALYTVQRTYYCGATGHKALAHFHARQVLDVVSGTVPPVVLKEIRQMRAAWAAAVKGIGTNAN